MEKSRTKLLNEAIADAAELKKLMEEKAKETLYETFNKRIKAEMKKVFESEEEEEEDVEVASDEIEDEDAEEIEESEEAEVEDEEEDSDEEIDIDEILKEIENELSDDEEVNDDDEEIDLDIEDDEEIKESEEFEDDEEIDLEIEDDEEFEEDEDIDLEIEDDEEFEDEEEMEEIKKLRKENRKFRQLTGTLSKQLNEMNLLNTKMKYVQQLAKRYDLSKISPEKLLEQFDKAKTVNEIKLTYSLLAENFKTKAVERKVKTKLNETVTVRKQNNRKESLNEDSDVIRIKKLAGIK